MVLKAYLFSFSAIFLFSALPLAAKPDPALYLKWHSACLEGDKKQIDTQIAKFEKRIAADPSDFLAKAYLGSALALRSRETFWGPQKLDFLKKGQAKLDGAVKSAPSDPRVRMVRAIGYYRIPKKFGVRATSLADFKIITPVAKSGGGGLKNNERQAILYYAWLANKEAGNSSAASLKKACHEIDPSSSYGKRTK